MIGCTPIPVHDISCRNRPYFMLVNLTKGGGSFYEKKRRTEAQPHHADSKKQAHAAND